MEKLAFGDSFFEIRSYKHDRTLHRVWKENIVLNQTEHELIGMNQATPVIESDGRSWVTKDPSLFYFHKQYWFNIIYIFNSEKRYYYCNISSPFICKDGVLSYIDYDLDIKVYDDLSYKILDEDEYQINKELMGYDVTTQAKIRQSVSLLKKWTASRKGPFQLGFVDKWYSYGQKYYK